MAERVACMVVGAGVVGLAIARELALTGREVVVAEANGRIGEETSARNNEVIHAGFLYPSGSLKARLCRPGRDMLYDYCTERGIPHRRVGKLMPALSEDEQGHLHKLVAQGRAVGVYDLDVLDQHEVTGLEPSMRCHGALISPSSGIVDSHALMMSLQGDAERHGATVALRSCVIGGRLHDNGFLLDVRFADGRAMPIECEMLINAAGLGARSLALALEGYPRARVPHIRFAKGCFYSYSGTVPFRHLVVPLGETLEQGGALTFDMGGQCRLGPDLAYIGTKDYSVAGEGVTSTAAAARRYWPEIEDGRLNPAYAGIRPRVAGSNEAAGDWLIEGPAEHGVAGLVHLFGIDTPGLTACLALGRHVANVLGTPLPRIHDLMEPSHA